MKFFSTINKNAAPNVDESIIYAKLTIHAQVTVNDNAVQYNIRRHQISVDYGVLNWSASTRKKDVAVHVPNGLESFVVRKQPP
jgi:hypothetical protein